MAASSEPVENENRKRNQRMYTLNEVLDIVMEDEELNNGEVRVYTMPPDTVGVDTDEDSADEDKPPLIANLSRRQLRARGLATVNTKSGRQIVGENLDSETDSASDSNEETQPKQSRKNNRKSAAVEHEPLDYLGFLRKLALAYVHKYRGLKDHASRPGSMELSVTEEVRQAQGGHYLISWSTQRRCRQCKGNTKKACSKCPATPLHEKCFEAFHSE